MNTVQFLSASLFSGVRCYILLVKQQNTFQLPKLLCYKFVSFYID